MEINKDEQIYCGAFVPKNDLIKGLKKSFLVTGFNKVATNRWERQIGEFTEVVYVQSDRLQKGYYYIRLGVIITNAPIRFVAEGHFVQSISIFNTSFDEILNKINEFFTNWTNKNYIKKYVVEQTDAWEEVKKYSGDELKLKRKEYGEKYSVAIFIRDIIPYVLSPEFLEK